jgi:D-alanine-D-alanine ligase-like ATP-grasp enzyme
MPKTFGYAITSPKGIHEEQTVSLSTRLVLEEAEKRGITWQAIPNSRMFELKYKDITRYFHYQMPSNTLEIGFSVCLNKASAKEFLQRAQVSTPRGYYIPMHVTDKAYWQEIFQALTKPLVVKPSHGKQGQAVHMNIETEVDFMSAVESVLKDSREDEEGALVEETFVGSEYRILATKEKVLGIINRVPANVVGDGTSTIQQLIDQKNSDPRRSDDIYDPLCKIKVDSHVQEHLTRQQLTVETVPAKDQQVFLRQNSNISTGGDSYDVTDIAHPSVLEIAVRTTQAIPGAYFVGIDFMTKDITQPQSAETYIIVEVNGSPGLSIHDFPYVGKSRDCAKELLFLIFPEVKDLVVNA